MSWAFPAKGFKKPHHPAATSAYTVGHPRKSSRNSEVF
jgi:hypothetical protein